MNKAWREHAACKDTPTDLFFDEDIEELEALARIKCRRMPGA